MLRFFTAGGALKTAMVHAGGRNDRSSRDSKGSSIYDRRKATKHKPEIYRKLARKNPYRQIFVFMNKSKPRARAASSGRFSSFQKSNRTHGHPINIQENPTTTTRILQISIGRILKRILRIIRVLERTRSLLRMDSRGNQRVAYIREVVTRP